MPIIEIHNIVVETKCHCYLENRLPRSRIFLNEVIFPAANLLHCRMGICNPIVKTTINLLTENTSLCITPRNLFP
uniref:Uncharacterized protein n=1 Tax=Anguilla anguilla TaxID=7936 RepID=A0A0E9WW26_ANGAN